MAEVLLFHHGLGLTPGCLAFADDVRAAGHLVHAPDLFEGRTFAERAEARAYTNEVGHDTLVERARLAAARLPNAIVYAGFSLGVLPAQTLAQTRPGAKGALLLCGCLPTAEIGRPWPPSVPLQIHLMEGDELADLEVARELAATIEDAELFLYPGERHLFADRSVPDYEASAATLLEQRVLSFLADVE